MLPEGSTARFLLFVPLCGLAGPGRLLPLWGPAALGGLPPVPPLPPFFFGIASGFECGVKTSIGAPAYAIAALRVKKIETNRESYCNKLVSYKPLDLDSGEAFGVRTTWGWVQ